VTVYCRQFIENYKCSPQFCAATFFHGEGYALILTKNWLGYILGDFFENSSGHPAELSRPEAYVAT
jgi:hypothetical protein